MSSRKNKIAHLAGIGLLLSLGGCFFSRPPPEAVLQGVWQLVPATQFTPPIENWLLTFNDDGELTQVSYQFAGLATVTWNNPNGATNVDGSSVYVSATQSGNGLTFSGTFNSDETVATGELTSNLIAGGLTISVTQGAATLTKQ